MGIATYFKAVSPIPAQSETHSTVVLPPSFMSLDHQAFSVFLHSIRVTGTESNRVPGRLFTLSGPLRGIEDGLTP